MVDTIQAAVGSIKGEAGGLGTLLQPLSGPIDQVEKMVALGPEYLDDNLAYALYGTCGLFGLLVLSVLVRVRSMLMFLNCLLWRRVNIYIIICSVCFFFLTAIQSQNTYLQHLPISAVVHLSTEGLLSSADGLPAFA